MSLLASLDFPTWVNCWWTFFFACCRLARSAWVDRNPKVDTCFTKRNKRFTPRKLTWQWKNKHLKMYILLNILYFHCHVSFRGCTFIHLYKVWTLNMKSENGTTLTKDQETSARLVRPSNGQSLKNASIFVRKNSCTSSSDLFLEISPKVALR